VLRSFLAADDVRPVMIVSRRPLDLRHPKIRRIVPHDVLDFVDVAAAFSGAAAGL
jgi:hypothetical protein